MARERFGSQNPEKLAGSGRFLKFKSPKFAPRCGARGSEIKAGQNIGMFRAFVKFKSPKLAPRCGARAIWKSKSVKTGVVGALCEVQAAKI